VLGGARRAKLDSVARKLVEAGGTADVFVADMTKGRSGFWRSKSQ